ncbi:Ig-like domain-containing protein [Arthrobacter silvisoli]|uniref:Ig-like domain-containing protein n=1 Tax=Arthrobacter silvisoli TaxID=2291022 RepID=UPI001FEBF4E0|nr:Ig-like domain-containing protein [Arthrobacter silvisoli]
MNRELRRQLLDEAAGRVAEHPADLATAVGSGMATVRRKVVLGSVIAVAVALALTAAFVAWRLAIIPPPPPTLESIAVTSVSQSLRPEVTIPLTATGRYSDGSARRLGEGVEWASSNPAVATVNGAGIVTAVAAGTAELTATLTGVSGRLALTVLDKGGPKLAGVHVSPETATMDQGGILQLLAEGSYSDGSRGNLNASALWSSGNPGIVTVDGAGLATAVAPGTATITASQDGLQGTSVITVRTTPKTVTALSVTPAKLTLKEGQTARLEAIASYSDGSSAAVGNATWEISPAGSTVAEVDLTGLVTARGIGNAAVVASLPGADGQLLTGRADVAVAPSVKGIEVSPVGPVQLEPGKTVQLRAVVFYSDGTTGSTVDWASSRPLIAAVDGSGLVSAVARGDAEITATADGVTGNAVTIWVRVSPD